MAAKVSVTVSLVDKVHYYLCPLRNIDTPPTTARSRSPTAKNYVFTLYEPFDKLSQFLADSNLPTGIQFFIGQYEVCPSTNRRHFQGYIQFERRCRGFNRIIEIFGSCHIEVARGSAQDNIDYCSKDSTRDEGPFTKGTSKTQGQRSDLSSFKEAIKRGDSLSTLAEDHFGAFIKYHKSVQFLRETLKPQRVPRFNMSNFNRGPLAMQRSTLVYGPSGCGKTQYAMAHFTKPLLITHMDDLSRLSTDHDGIVFDDLDFRHHPFSNVINLLDVDEDRSVHIRYLTAIIPAGTPRIFTHNTDSIFNLPDLTLSQYDAIERRLIKVSVDNLF